MIFTKKTMLSLLMTAALVGSVAAFAEEGDLMLDQATESETGERDLLTQYPVCRIRRRIPTRFRTIYLDSQAEVDAWLNRRPGDLRGKCDDSCAILCDDDNECTIDFDGSCEANGCSAVPRKQISCNSNLCMVGSCDAKTGCQYKQKDCDDKDPCTKDKCKERTGTCVHKPIKCNDGNLCTTDTCEGGVCVFKEVICQKSSDPCKIGTCDKNSGACTYTDIKCVSSDPCQIGRCNRNGNCRYDPKCDDGLLCTVDTCDALGKCTNTPKDCSDGNPCTVNTCNAATGNCDESPVVCPPGEKCSRGKGCHKPK